MNDDNIPGLPHDWNSLGYMAAGILVSKLLPKVSDLLSWLGVEIKSKKQADAERRKELIDYLEEADRKKDARIEKLETQVEAYLAQLHGTQHSMAELQFALGKTQQRVDEVKVDTELVNKAATTLKNLAEKE